MLVYDANQVVAQATQSGASNWPVTNWHRVHKLVHAVLYTCLMWQTSQVWVAASATQYDIALEYDSCNALDNRGQAAASHAACTSPGGVATPYLLFVDKGLPCGA